jgi:hypothetical protein
MRQLYYFRFLYKMCQKICKIFYSLLKVQTNFSGMTLLGYLCRKIIKLHVTRVLRVLIRDPVHFITGSGIRDGKKSGSGIRNKQPGSYF